MKLQSNLQNEIIMNLTNAENTNYFENVFEKYLIPKKKVFGFVFEEKYRKPLYYQNNSKIREIFENFFIYKKNCQILDFNTKEHSIFCSFEGVIQLKPGIILKKKLDCYKIDDLNYFNFYNINNLIFISNLRKLIIKNLQIFKINLECLKRLEYLKITNCRLEKIIFPNKILNYCDLSNNKLTSNGILISNGIFFESIKLNNFIENLQIKGNCTKNKLFASNLNKKKENNNLNNSIKARFLNLSKNKIKYFKSEIFYKFINLSKNPLKKFFADGKSINISNTKVKNKLTLNCKKLIANNVKNIKIANFSKFEYLAINNCNLKKLFDNENDAQKLNLKYLFAANNYFWRLPHLENIKVIDFSGNFINKLSLKNIEVLNISKNHIFKIDFEAVENLKWIDAKLNLMSEKEILRNFEKSENFLNLKLNSYNNLIYKGKDSYINQITCKFRKNENIFTFICTAKTTEKINLKNILLKSINIQDFNQNGLIFFENLSNSIFSSINQIGGIKTTASFTMIVENFVFVKSFGLKTIIVTFFRNIIIISPKKTIMFKNLHEWNIIHAFFSPKKGCTKREYKLPADLSDYKKVFEFFNYKSAIVLEYLITNCNSHTITDSNSFIKTDSGEYQIIKNNQIFTKNYTKSFEEVLKNMPKISQPGLNIYGFPVGQIDIHDRFSFETTTNPTFAFLKINYIDSERDGIIFAETKNVIKIVDRYSKIYCGYVIERTSTTVILGFSSPLSAAQWGLKVFSALKLLRIDVSVGITQETVFRTVYNGHVKYSGPVFYKLQRIVSSGIGVFCCECVPISHTKILLTDEGERILKGYQLNHRIFSIKYCT